jgi:hypothetical protein
MSTSVSEVSHALKKEVRSRIRGFTDPRDAKEYALEHEEDLARFPTSLLNVWNKIPGYKFSRDHGRIRLIANSSKRYSTMTELREKISELEGKVMALEAKVAALEGKVAAKGTEGLEGRISALEKHMKMVVEAINGGEAAA